MSFAWNNEPVAWLSEPNGAAVKTSLHEASFCESESYTFGLDQATDNAILDQLCKMVEVDIPRSFFEEQGRQLYGSQLLQIQANMKLSEQQLASLSSPKAVNEFLEHQNENIAKVIKQKLAVGDIFKPENLQFSTEELVKEVENSIAEFKRHKQEYDEDNVKEHQVNQIKIVPIAFTFPLFLFWWSVCLFCGLCLYEDKTYCFVRKSQQKYHISVAWTMT